MTVITPLRNEYRLSVTIMTLRDVTNCESERNL
jgi:hypothetical protein